MSFLRKQESQKLLKSLDSRLRGSDKLIIIRGSLYICFIILLFMDIPFERAKV